MRRTGIGTIIIQEEVREALQAGRPVVALETTIISHGMPYPRNLETAELVETTIRNKGAVPATIAILDGVVRVGLDRHELEFLATDPHIEKASRRDLPAILAKGLHAATTVAATMICAHAAGIRFFATGGIGGVHRGAGTTFDISADLQEFARTPVAVISAGAKAILDLPLTLEYLETLGIPVIGDGTDEFPAFYTPQSGLRIPRRADSAQEAARIAHAAWMGGLGGEKTGLIIANPVPQHFAMDSSIIEAAIEQALRDAADQGVSGKEITPYLLARITEITGGTSLETNIHLVENNAAAASDIAVAYQAIVQGTDRA